MHNFFMFETKIISVSQDETVCIWDALDGLLENTLEGRTDGVNSVAYSSDGTKIISGSHDKSIRIWDAKTWTLENMLEGNIPIGCIPLRILRMEQKLSLVHTIKPYVSGIHKVVYEEKR